MTEAGSRLWTLVKDGRTATCEVRPHPLGVELVATVDGEVVRTEVARTAPAERGLAAEWRGAFDDRGWSSVAGRATNSRQKKEGGSSE